MPYYNFDWQRGVAFEQPYVIPAGTRIRIEGQYDNSSDNPRNPDAHIDVPWGKFTDINEMFKGTITFVDAADLPRLQRRMEELRG
jgi:hypothetical protein